MFPNDAGTAHTRARPRRLPATSPTAISRLGCRTGNGPRASSGIKARDGKGVPLAAGRLLRRQDRRVHGRVPVPMSGSPTGCSSGPRRRCRRERIPVYFVKLRWTCSALNLNTVGVQLEHRRRLVPCFVVCLVYFMRECLFR